MSRPISDVPAVAAAVAAICAAWADGACGQSAPPPAPIGVFGADMPAKDKLVISVLPSFTRMQVSMIGSQTVSPDDIVSNVVSAYTPVGTNLLRMVPKDLTVDSQGFSLAYGLTNRVSLFASTAVIEKQVDMQAFKGLSGLTSLGFSTGSTSGLGDTTVATIVRVLQDQTSRLNLNFGLSLPTGSTTDDITLLLPSDTAPAKRGFYAMQPGTGTVDALFGAAVSGSQQAWSWGLSYRGRVPLDHNGEGWRYGDLQELNAWGGHSWLAGLETTLRLNATVQGHIVGQDPQILGYAQGADPLFYGGRQLSLFGGVVLSGRFIGAPAGQLGLEAGAPLYQNLNGPQLGRNWQVNLALRYRL